MADRLEACSGCSIILTSLIGTQSHAHTVPIKLLNEQNQMIIYALSMVHGVLLYLQSILTIVHHCWLCMCLDGLIVMN